MSELDELKKEYEKILNEEVDHAKTNFLDADLGSLIPPDRRPPQLPAMEGLKLAKREVVSQSGPCGAGHNHRMIALVETFNTAGAPEGEQVLSLEDAITELKAKATDFPADNAGMAEPLQIMPQLGFNPQTGDMQRALVLRDAFHTEASLEAEKNAPQGGDLQAILQQLFGGGRGPGGAGPGGGSGGPKLN